MRDSVRFTRAHIVEDLRALKPLDAAWRRLSPAERSTLVAKIESRIALALKQAAAPAEDKIEQVNQFYGHS